MADFFVIAGAVYLGGMLSASCLWGMSRLHRDENSLLAYAAVLLPLVFILLVVIGSQGFPPA